MKKKFDLKEIVVYVLAFLMIAWTVCSVFGVIGFVRTKADSNLDPQSYVYSDEVLNENQPLAIEYNEPVSYASNSFQNGVDGYSFHMDILNSLVFESDLGVSVFEGTFTYVHTNDYINIIYEVGQYNFTFNVITGSTTQRCYYKMPTNLDGDYGDMFVKGYANSLNDYQVNEMRISSYNVATSYPKEYSIYLLADNRSVGLSDYVLEICIDYYSSTGYAKSVYITISTSFMQLDYGAYISSRGTPCASGGIVESFPINGLDFSYIKSSSYIDGYEKGKTDGYGEGYIDGFDEGTKFGESNGYVEGYEQGKQDGYDEFYYKGYAQGQKDGYDVGIEDGYDDGYEQGKQDGLTEGDGISYDTGFNDGYDKGYQIGYDRGESVGEIRGRAEGVESANTYTFTRLVAAVLDVPVKTFTSLFDFTILGYNLKGFFLSLFTVAIIFGLIKLFTGNIGGGDEKKK